MVTVLGIFVTIYNYRAHNYFITIVMKFRNYFPSSNNDWFLRLLVAQNLGAVQPAIKMSCTIQTKQLLVEQGLKQIPICFENERNEYKWLAELTLARPQSPHRLTPVCVLEMRAKPVFCDNRIHPCHQLNQAPILDQTESRSCRSHSSQWICQKLAQVLSLPEP